MSKEIPIVRNVLEANDRLADELNNNFRVQKLKKVKTHQHRKN